MRISDWSSDVCSSDLAGEGVAAAVALQPRQAEAVFELVDRQRACDQPGAVAAPDDNLLRLLAALRQVAGDRLEAVGEGGDPFGRAVLVDYHHHVDALAADTNDQLQPGTTLGPINRRTHGPAHRGETDH